MTVTKVTLTAVLLLLLAGCATKTNTTTKPPSHANQLNAFDGQTYDTLLVAQSAIESAQEQLKAGKLPEKYKPLIVKAALSYNTAQALYKTWRSIYTGAQAGDLATVQAELTTNIVDLTTQIDALKQMVSK